MYLWWSLHTLYLCACQVRVTVGDSGLCSCVCVRYFKRQLTPLWVVTVSGKQRRQTNKNYWQGENRQNCLMILIYSRLQRKRHPWRTSTNRVPSEIKRREVELDPQVSPEEIMSREVELGCENWTSFTSGCFSTAEQRTLSL